MAIQPEGSPTPQQAQQALQQLASDQDAVRYPPLPRWFFAVMAGLVALLHLAQLLAPSDASSVRFALAVVAIVVGGRYWLHRDGVAWVKVRLSDMAPFLAAVLGTYAVCWMVSATSGAGWVWIVGAAIAGGVVMATGRRYRQEFGDVD